MSETRAAERQNLSLAAKVAALKDRDLYPDRPAKVELTETHMSCVFLTDDYVYKLKKPVRYEFLDFSTPELRRHYCEEEVRLNRCLAPDVYLGVVALKVGAEGRLTLDGGGRTVDWLVKMRRLPQHRMLDTAIRTRALADEDVDRVARLLAGYYRTRRSVPMAPSEYRDRFARDIELSRRELVAYGMSRSEIDGLFSLHARFLCDDPQLLEYRARSSHIVEGHGDLRPEHVYLGPPPMIIDRLEFSRDLRLIDPVDELCFLTMECELLGDPRVGERALLAYKAATGDEAPPRLMQFYKSFRAILRARLTIWHLRDPHVADPAKWLARTRDYIRLASRHAAGIAL